MCRHQSGPRHGTRASGGHADEKRAREDGEAKPDSIAERHCAALVQWQSVPPKLAGW
jgi:hypothetical protein